MKNKTFIYIALLLVAIISLPLLRLLEKKQKMMKIIELDSNKINEISIEDESGKVVLIKEENVWKLKSLDNIVADTLKVNDIFRNIIYKEISSTPLSSNKKFHEKFRVVDSLATKLIISDGTKTESLFLGKSKNYMTSYLRKKDNDDVFQVNKNIIGRILSTDNGSWRSPYVFQIDLNDVKEIELKNPATEYKINVRSDGWFVKTSTEQFRIKESGNRTLMKLKNRLAEIKTLQYLDNKYKEYEAYFENPDWEIKISDLNGKSTTLKFIEKDGKIIAKKNNETKHLPILIKSFVSQLIPDYNLLKQGKDF